jgi:indole-3-glycerol phosphate synthase
MDILNQIVEQKQLEVAQRKELYPTRLLEKSIYFESPTVSLKKYVKRLDKSGIIAEIKRQSPSKGVINNHVSVERTSIGYIQAGASALSILTDKNFFGGSNEDLMTARKYNFCPILRKDFTIDEYQIIEAKSIGADAILLIAAILSPQQIKIFTSKAHQLGLEVLLEVHSSDELEKSIDDTIDLIGVNNRNLKTFELDLNISKCLVETIPSTFVKISESGIDSPTTIVELRKLGFDGFLMGQNFMQHSHPEEAANEFIKQLNKLNAQ